MDENSSGEDLAVFFGNPIGGKLLGIMRCFFEFMIDAQRNEGAFRFGDIEVTVSTTLEKVVRDGELQYVFVGKITGLREMPLDYQISLACEVGESEADALTTCVA